MANQPYASTTFTATGDGPTLQASRIAVGVTGTFVGTIKIVWTDQDGVDHNLQSGGSDITLTAPGDRFVDLLVPMKVRLKCTAYASGSIVTSMTGDYIHTYR